jgi:ribosome-binding factor A
MRKNSIKNVRINQEVQKELSSLIMRELKDPRIHMMTSITRTEVAPDLKTAKIYVSVLGTDDELVETVKGLKRAAPFLRSMLAKSLNMQTSLNGFIKIRNMVDLDKKLLKIKEFEKQLQDNASGFLALDIIEDVIPMQKQVQLLDATTLEFIDRKILRFWGVSIPIINGDYTKDQYDAFYQKAIEPIVKTFAQAFTKGIFTKHRAQGFNNRIDFLVKELIFMNTDQKLNLFKDLSAQGGAYVNEYRQAFGMRPDPALAGVRMQSLNWVDTKYAKEYQTGKKRKEAEDGD